MPSKSNRGIQRKITLIKIKKLQRAGLLGAVDLKKKPTPQLFAAFTRYKDVLSGRAAVVQTKTRVQAGKLRRELGLKGSGKSVIIPREKGERFSLSKDNEIKSTRKIYGQTVKKKIGKFKAPVVGGKSYYTIPSRRRGLGRLKRTTFSSFDEMLFYLQKYEINFEDIEDYIEVEEFAPNSEAGKKQADKIARQRKRAVKRIKSRKAKTKNTRSRRK